MLFVFFSDMLCYGAFTKAAILYCNAAVHSVFLSVVVVASIKILKFSAGEKNFQFMFLSNVC